MDFTDITPNGILFIAFIALIINAIVFYLIVKSSINDSKLKALLQKQLEESQFQNELLKSQLIYSKLLVRKSVATVQLRNKSDGSISVYSINEYLGDPGRQADSFEITNVQ